MQSGATAFESGTNDNPFAAILPLETEAYCLVPVFDYDGSAALFLVITSDEKHFRFVSSVVTLRLSFS